MKTSFGEYCYPLPLDADRAHVDWVELGRRIANRAPVIPQNELKIEGVFLTCASPESHTGPFVSAIDFLVPDGTEILAAADGMVHAIEDSHSAWGPTKASAGSLNYVTLRHNHAGRVEYSQYCHLAQGSSKKLGLRIGSFVKTGQPIGLVGKTGWTDRDHLHFMVFRSVAGTPGFQSLSVKFKNFELAGKEAYYS